MLTRVSRHVAEDLDLAIGDVLLILLEVVKVALERQGKEERKLVVDREVLAFSLLPQEAL